MTRAGKSRSVGQSIPRVDGWEKVTGAARYVDDLPFPEAWIGRTARSPVAAGILRGIEFDPAFDWQSVSVVTAQDIPGPNVVTLIEDDQPVLVPIGGVVRHIEEPIALVAAATAEQAARALEHIRFDIDTKPALLDLDESLAGKLLLHGEDNVFKRLELHKGGDVDAALASADLVIEGEYFTGSQEQMYIEPQGMVAVWEGLDRCQVFGSLQCPYYVHAALGPVFELEPDRIEVIQAVTGGGFGGKEDYPSVLAIHAALLARKAERPVKMIYDREEDIGVTPKRHPSRVRHRMGFRRDGTIVAADIDFVLDGGAYVTLSPVVLSRGLIHAPGPYRIPHVRAVGRVVATNHPPYGAFRGFGAPQTTFAYERQMQKAAQALGLNPFELRRRNLLRLGDETATGQRLEESVGSVEVLEAAEAALQKPAPEGTRTRALAYGADPTRLKQGRGLAFYFHGAGFTGSGEERLQGRATVAYQEDGSFEVRSSSTDIGQGTLTIFSQLAADELGVDVERVRLSEPSTAVVPDSGPTVASRTCMIVGGVVAGAARELRERLEEHGREHGLAGDIFDFAAHRQAAGEVVSATQTYRLPPGIRWDDETYTGAAYPAYGWAACVVDVTVDLDTYEVAVDRCVHVIDVGKAIHPVIVEGQIEGGTLQALGWALWENVAWDQGRVANRRMTDCIIPTSIEAPELETILVEQPFSGGPHGAKGVGEIPHDGPAAAVAGAIEAALGVPCDEVPLLPERIEEILCK